MAGDAVRYRPHLWQAIAFFVMTPLFGLLAFGLMLVDPTVEISCRRQDAETSCEVVTEGLLRPSVARLSDADLRGARLDLVPEPHDRSFKKVELRQQETVRRLADFTPSTRHRAVRAVNDFLAGGAADRISARVVDPGRSPWQRFGLFPFQLIALLTLAGVYSAARRTILTTAGAELEVRRTRWPRSALVERWPLREIAGVEVVWRIPKELAPAVASLPWRNVYGGTALAIRTAAGAEVLITDLSKRSRALHERMAATLRGWLPPRRENE
jgi:hypothetical protein